MHIPQYPGFEDFGDVMLRGNGGTGYIRVDWFTPDGLGTWGDGRLTILGTDGFIEIRKNVDIGGRPGGNHLFLVDQKETRYIDCSKVALPYGQLLVDDIVNRTETAMTQEHCFLAMELALKARRRRPKSHVEEMPWERKSKVQSPKSKSEAQRSKAKFPITKRRSSNRRDHGWNSRFVS